MKKMIVLLSMIFLTGCAVKDCKFNPQVELGISNNKSSSMLKDIQDRAQPSGLWTCKY